MSTLLLIHSSINIHSDQSEQEVRDNQIKTAIKQFMQWNYLYKKYNFDIIFYDNTCKELRQEFKNLLDKNIKVITVDNNVSGKINKGCGLIEGWQYLKDTVKSYEWIIHFESRLFLTEPDFFTRFHNKPDTYVRKTSNYKKIPNYWTGLFSMRTEDLLNYVDKEDIKYLLESQKDINSSIEIRLFKYCVNNKIHVQLVKRVGTRRNYYNKKKRGVLF